MKWIPGHDSQLDFWRDSWSDLGPLRSILHGPLPLEASNLKVKDVISPHGWLWSAIPFVLPPEIKKSIQVVPFPIAARSVDKLAWKGSPKGVFSPKGAYRLATQPSKANVFPGAWIWKICTLPKIQMFIWKCMHNSVGVRGCLVERGLHIPLDYPLCHTEPETVSHALCDCNFVKPIWQQLGQIRGNQAFYSQGIRDWLASNAKAKASRIADEVPWNIVFPFALWLIWKQRNQVVFNQKSPNPCLTKLIKMQATEFFLCINRPKGNRRMVIRQIRWEKPTSGWLKLNTDGSFDDLLGNIGGGGLIRNEQGDWVAGYTKKVGKANSFVAEAWALRDGLMLCNQMNLSNVIVELDAKALVDALNNPDFNNSVISPLFDDCKQLAAQIPQIVFRHIYREANLCADRLANVGRLQSLDFILYTSPPVDLVPFIVADSQGLYSERLCLDSLSSC